MCFAVLPRLASTGVDSAAPAPVPSPQQVAALGANGPGMALTIARGDQVLFRGARGGEIIGLRFYPDGDSPQTWTLSWESKR